MERVAPPVPAGFTGGGLSWAGIVGPVIADVLDGADPGFDLVPFVPGRFAAGGTAWSIMFTARERECVPATETLAP